MYYLIDVFPVFYDRHIIRKLVDIKPEQTELFFNKSNMYAAVPESEIVGLDKEIVTGVTQRSFFQQNMDAIINLAPVIKHDQHSGLWELDFNAQSLKMAIRNKYCVDFRERLLTLFPEWKQLTMMCDKDAALDILYKLTGISSHDIIADADTVVSENSGSYFLMNQSVVFVGLSAPIHKVCRLYSRVALSRNSTTDSSVHPAPMPILERNFEAVMKWCVLKRLINSIRDTTDRIKTELEPITSKEDIFFFHSPDPESLR